MTLQRSGAAGLLTSPSFLMVCNSPPRQGYRGFYLFTAIRVVALTLIRSLSADRDTGLQVRWPNDLHERRRGHQLDPRGLSVAEPGGLIRCMQCVHAALFGAG